MPIINLNIPGNIITRIENAVAKKRGRTDNIPDPGDPQNTISNPQSKNDFLLDKIKEFLIEEVASQEASEASDTAGDTAREKARADLDVIVITP